MDGCAASGGRASGRGGGGAAGDHIYSDVLLSKKTLGWRTMLVVPELETEIRILRQNTSIAQVPSPSPSPPPFVCWRLYVRLLKKKVKKIFFVVFFTGALPAPLPPSRPPAVNC